MKEEYFWIKFKKSNEILQQLSVKIPIFVISSTIVKDMIF